MLVAVSVGCALAVGNQPDAAHGLSSNVTVTANVASATSLNTGACATGTTNVTAFGTVALNSNNVTSSDCVLVFGSSNDASMLRVYQQDGVGTAMGGITWTAQASGTAQNIAAISAASSSVAWGGLGGQVDYTANGGTTWTPQVVPSGQNVNGVAAASTTTAWAVGDSGSIAKTINSGTNWVAQASGVAVALDAVAAFDTSTAWAGGGTGKITRTVNGGTNWIVNTTCTTDDVHAIGVVSASIIFSGGDSGALCRSTDGGATWGAVTSNTTANITSIAVIDANTAVLTASGGVIRRTVDGGTNWTVVASGTTQPLNGVTYAGNGTLYAVGGGGAVLVSYNSGASWTSGNTGTTTALNAVTNGGGAVWAAGAGGALYKQGSSSVADYVPAVSDWGTGPSMFAACLNTVSAGASTAPGPSPALTWQTNAGCPTAGVWNAIPATSGAAGAKIAQTLAPTTTAQATLRFGFKVTNAQTAGLYSVPLVFEVLAPNA